MSAVRELIRITLIAACAAVTFGGVQVYLTAQDQLRDEAGIIEKKPPVKIASNGDVNKPLSPVVSVIPAKHLLNVSQPAQKMAKQAARPAKPIVAPRPVKPNLQTASRPLKLHTRVVSNEEAVTNSYAAEPEKPRALGIFSIFR